MRMLSRISVCLCLLLLFSCSQQRFAFRKTVPYSNQTEVTTHTTTSPTTVISQNVEEIEATYDIPEKNNLYATLTPTTVNDSHALSQHPYYNKKIIEEPLYVLPIDTNATPKPIEPEEKPLENYALVGIILAIAGLFVFGLLLGIIAIVFGIVALVRIKRNNTRGTAAALFAILFGLADIIGVLILAATFY